MQNDSGADPEEAWQKYLTDLAEFAATIPIKSFFTYLPDLYDFEDQAFGGTDGSPPYSFLVGANGEIIDRYAGSLEGDEQYADFLDDVKNLD